GARLVARHRRCRGGDCRVGGHPRAHPLARSSTDANADGWKSMKRFLFAAMALVIGCNTRPCKDGTILLSVHYSSVALSAEQLAVQVTVDGALREDTTIDP